MKDLSKFQLITLGVFAAFIVIGVIVFATGRISGPSHVAELTVWGTMPQRQFSDVLSATGLNKNEGFDITYVQKSRESFDIEFLEALASGRGPDIFFLPADSIFRHRERIFTIPFRSVSERDFKTAFIEGSEIFLTEEGIMAFPVLIDPLVMYWNRDIFTSRGLVTPPEYWDELYDLSAILTVKDGSLNIRRGTVALGEYSNVTNAFEILSALIMQAGSPISARQGGRVISVLDQSFGLPAVPAERALSFYTDFSNSLRAFYSWNRSLPWSRDYFTDGDLAVYFGFASELFEIQDRNPNLNFDVATIPQSRESEKRLTYGKVEAIALNRNSRKIQDAFNLAVILSNRNHVSAFSQVRSLPPVRRELLSQRPERAFMEVFYDGAIISKNWLVPDRGQANEIFRNMVESVTGGRSRPREAVISAGRALNSLFSN